MRLGWTKSKNSVSYYAQKTVYVDGKNKSEIVKWFGPAWKICEENGVTDAKAWCKEQVALMNKAEEEENGKVLLELPVAEDIPLGEQRRFNGGYLFLQSVYYELGLHKICRAVAKKHKFEYDLNEILSRLIYTRILYPASKKASFEDSKRFIEQPSFELHQIYRALTVLAQDSDYIQSRLYKNSKQLGARRTGVIYYDCTNYFFEIEQEKDDKQYGVSKENRPLPIVQMGLFMDADGIPLAFCINPGNTSEQKTMIPLEKKLLEDFELSQFVVCTDAGLSSMENRKFNNYDKEDGMRSFITTQSVKKLKGFLKEWALSDEGWHLSGGDGRTKYNLSELDDEKDREKIFYKDRWIKENGLEQRLIVTYSIKYRDYLRSIRSGHIERAAKAVEDPSRISHKRQTDYKRFIKEGHATKDGEVADKAIYDIDTDRISEEEKYDGFYAACTNLEDTAETIIKVNKWRWQIEECFRIMKSEFKARPVYLQDKERIKAHFMTCFIALVVYRYVEKKLGGKYTCSQIIDTLSEMDFLKFDGKGYIPVYTRTELTDDLHEAFGFNTSRQIITPKKMRSICHDTKAVTSENSGHKDRKNP